ncbi:MAG: hypothetical protein WA728_04860 [Xanthobacteraceae bacterium]
MAVAETISDPIRPEAEETKERPQQSAVKPNDPSTGQALTVLDEHSSGKTAPRLKLVTNGNTAAILLDHPNQLVARELIMQAFGTEDDDFAKGLLQQLGANSGGDEAGINFLLSVIKGVKPNDQLEAMLAAQMAVSHSLVMKSAHRLNHAQTIQEQDSAERAYNKLARTFTTQLEALKRHRTGGDQKVTVQQVSVSEGGQAIVGNVTRGT